MNLPIRGATPARSVGWACEAAVQEGETLIRTRQVVIVGAGVGGLSAAIALRRCGLGVVVLEQAAELREVGAGVLLWPDAIRVLRRLEVGSAIEQAGAVAAHGTLRSARGTPLGAALAEIQT